MVEKQATSELMEAATAFDDELARFGRLVEAARTGPLNSQKHLQRAARAFEQLAESEQRLGVAAQTLVGALQIARQRQEAQAQAIQGRAREIEARTTVAAELLQRYDAVVASLAKLRERMGEVADIAGGLVASAREADFEDIARQADSLRQQIASVGQKVAAIERALSARSAPG